MKLNLNLCYILIFLSSSNFLIAQEIIPINMDDLGFTIPNNETIISIGIPLVSAIEVLGTPIESSISENSSGPEWDTFIYKWDGLIITGFRQFQKVKYIYIDSPNYELVRGIQVGSSRSDVLEAYPPDYQRSDLIQCYFQPEEMDSYQWVLSFKIEDGKVVRILINISD